LSISKRTLNRLIAGGTFPAPLKIGRASRIAREDIAGYLETLRRERGDKLGTS
jgi:excisionase family DNA binding protein